MTEQTDEELARQDEALYGVSFTKNGKRIDPREVVVAQTDALREKVKKIVWDADTPSDPTYDKIIQAIKDAGFAIVPREPTEAMLDTLTRTGGTWQGIYSAMLEAAEGE